MADFQEMKKIQLLKPCPFCGGEAAMYDDRNGTYSVRGWGACSNVVPTYYRAYCTACGAQGATVKVDGDRYNTWWQKEAKQQAANAWNARSGND